MSEQLLWFAAGVIVTNLFWTLRFLLEIRRIRRLP
jgi:hypothetical protein